ncbi:MAG: CpsD/CapB family tyrosine-protein kinase [bacterium]
MPSQTYYYEETPEATAFRRLYNKLQWQNESHGTKVFLMTSTGIGDGKSTISAYLATASARYRGTPTILIDCDLRRPVVHKMFGLPNRHGVADLLSQNLDLKSVLKPSAIPNLMIITAGIANQSPADLLSSVHLKEMFNQIRFYFKIVIVDAPPVLPVSDSLLLGNEADGILFVLKAGRTQKRMAQRAVELLDDNRHKLLGTIINNVEGALPYYYDHRYYKYNYYRNGQ